MKADRSLVGIILIALVVSTLVTLFIVGEKGGPYSIIKNEYRSGGRLRFISGLTLLAKEPMGSLRISHYCLINRTDLICGLSGQGSPEEVCRRVPCIESYLGLSYFREPEIRKFSVEVPKWIDEKTLILEKFDLYLYDFSKVVWQAVPDDLMYSTERPVFKNGHLWDYYNVFACLFDENGNLTLFYEGVADFYCNKVISIEELTVQKNENKSIYFGVTEEGKVQERVLSVLNAPDRGVVRFEDVDRNDRLAVTFSIDPSRKPQDPTRAYGQFPMYKIMHIVEISPDEGNPEYVTNMVNPPKPIPEEEA